MEERVDIGDLVPGDVVIVRSGNLRETVGPITRIRPSEAGEGLLFVSIRGTTDAGVPVEKSFVGRRGDGDDAFNKFYRPASAGQTLPPVSHGNEGQPLAPGGRRKTRKRTTKRRKTRKSRR